MEPSGADRRRGWTLACVSHFGLWLNKLDPGWGTNVHYIQLALNSLKANKGKQRQEHNHSSALRRSVALQGHVTSRPGCSKEIGDQLLSMSTNSRTRSHLLSLEQGRLRLIIRKTFVATRIVQYWDRSLREGVGSPSLERTKKRLD